MKSKIALMDLMVWIPISLMAMATAITTVIIMAMGLKVKAV